MPRDILLWPFRQVYGLLLNWFDFFTSFDFADALPEAWRSTIVFLANSFPRSLGFTSDPGDQLVNVVIFTILMIVASATTLTAVAIIYALIFLPLALLRFWPVINDNWPVDENSWIWSIDPP
jgi:hypothetical protein